MLLLVDLAKPEIPRTGFFCAIYCSVSSLWVSIAGALRWLLSVSTFWSVCSGLSLGCFIFGN